MEKAQQQRLVVLRTMDGASVREIRDELESLLKPIDEKPPSVSTIHAWQKKAERLAAGQARANAPFLPTATPRSPPPPSSEPLVMALPLAAKPEAAVRPDPSPPKVVAVDPSELTDTDPRRVRDRSVTYYTKMIAISRSKAEEALLEGNFREARDIGALAKSYEERRDELLPPPAPDPDQDPAYRQAGEKLVDDLREVMNALQRRSPMPARTLAPIEIVQPT